MRLTSYVRSFERGFDRVTSNDGRASLYYTRLDGGRNIPGTTYLLETQWPNAPAPNPHFPSHTKLYFPKAKGLGVDVPIYEDGILRILITVEHGQSYTEDQLRQFGLVPSDLRFDAPFSQEKRDSQMQMRDEFGARLGIRNSDPEFIRFTIPEIQNLLEIFVPLYFELTATYKFNNDDPEADPDGRYPDQLHFYGLGVEKKYHKAFYAVESGK
jgi:hypothetical protein